MFRIPIRRDRTPGRPERRWWPIPSIPPRPPEFDACYDRAAKAFRMRLANGFFRHRKMRKYRCQVIWAMRSWLKDWRERRPTKRALQEIAARKAELDTIERLC